MPPTWEVTFYPIDRLLQRIKYSEQMSQRHPSPLAAPRETRVPAGASPQPPSPGGAPASAHCTRSGCPGTSGPWPGPRRLPGPGSASGLRKQVQKLIRASEKKAVRAAHPALGQQNAQSSAGLLLATVQCRHAWGSQYCPVFPEMEFCPDFLFTLTGRQGRQLS